MRLSDAEEKRGLIKDKDTLGTWKLCMMDTFFPLLWLTSTDDIA